MRGNSYSAEARTGSSTRISHAVFSRDAALGHSVVFVFDAWPSMGHLGAFCSVAYCRNDRLFFVRISAEPFERGGTGQIANDEAAAKRKRASAKHQGKRAASSKTGVPTMAWPVGPTLIDGVECRPCPKIDYAQRSPISAISSTKRAMSLPQTAMSVCVCLTGMLCARPPFATRASSSPKTW